MAKAGEIPLSKGVDRIDQIFLSLVYVRLAVLSAVFLGEAPSFNSWIRPERVSSSVMTFRFSMAVEKAAVGGRKGAGQNGW